MPYAEEPAENDSPVIECDNWTTQFKALDASGKLQATRRFKELDIIQSYQNHQAA